MVDAEAKNNVQGFLEELNQEIDNFSEKVQPGQLLHVATASHLVRLTGLTRDEIKPIMIEWIESKQ